jgi:putative ABC transport system ATP-binding protein
LDILSAQNVSKTYHIGDRSIQVLKDISLSVSDGEFIVIAGRSGSGKTTLLSLLSGLDHPSAGRIYIQGKDITESAEDDLAPLRNVIFGFVFQSFHLIPSLTALENVMFPAQLNKDPAAAPKALDLLQKVGLQHRSDNLPQQLSGGEMQRVAICRALINQPRIIFADEPTGNLDSHSGRAILDLLLDFRQEGQTTLVMVTHNREIATMADRIVKLKDGRIIDNRAEHAEL